MNKELKVRIDELIEWCDDTPTQLHIDEDLVEENEEIHTSLVQWSPEGIPGTVTYTEDCHVRYVFTLHYGKGPLFFYHDIAACLGDLAKLVWEFKLTILTLEALEQPQVHCWRQFLDLAFQNIPIHLRIIRRKRNIVPDLT